MKNEIPPRTSTAPAAIPIAAPPDSELDPDVPVVEIVGTAVVVVGVGPEGSDGENGLLPVLPPGRTADPADPVDPADPADPVDPVEPEAATATTGAPSNEPSTPAITNRQAIRRSMASTSYRSDASGCSIAGVSGAVRYGSSFSWCSSW
jgi:hypothetical protein